MTQNGAGVARAQQRDQILPVSPTKSRRSLLDLAPLELDCMNTLWGMREATVREIRDGLAVKLPRAYTTIMTIMDRLARKGVVERRKAGRSYIYRPQLSIDDARRQAMRQVVDHFFSGSTEAAVDFLESRGATVPQSLESAILPPAAPTFSPSPIDAASDAPILSSASPAPALADIPASIETPNDPHLPK